MQNCFIESGEGNATLERMNGIYMFTNTRERRECNREMERKAARERRCNTVIRKRFRSSTHSLLNEGGYVV